jgi:hypothetical protein
MVAKKEERKKEKRKNGKMIVSVHRSNVVTSFIPMPL